MRMSALLLVVVVVDGGRGEVGLGEKVVEKVDKLRCCRDRQSSNICTNSHQSIRNFRAKKWSHSRL